MKFGDPVIFTENGKEYFATVLGSRVLDHHNGENDEPLVHLAFFREVLSGDGKSVINVVGTARELELVQVRHDVAHESHAFTDDQREAAKKARVPLPEGAYPGGRWREIVAPVAPVPALPEPSGEGSPAIQ